MKFTWQNFQTNRRYALSECFTDFHTMHTHAVLRPFFELHLGEPVLSASHKGETYWNNLWIFMSRMSFQPLNL